METRSHKCRIATGRFCDAGRHARLAVGYGFSAHTAIMEGREYEAVTAAVNAASQALDHLANGGAADWGWPIQTACHCYGMYPHTHNSFGEVDITTWCRCPQAVRNLVHSFWWSAPRNRSFCTTCGRRCDRRNRRIS